MSYDNLILCCSNGDHILNISGLKKKLLENLVKEGIVKTPEVIRAFLKVPREEFVPEEYRFEAYYDYPLPIGHGQTISAPHMVLLMTEKLEPRLGMKVLEIGTGSGYQAAIIAEIVAPSSEDKSRWGKVITIERIPMLAKYARKNLEKTGYSDRVKVIVGDGTKGYPEDAPYDRIIVTAAAPVIPESLVRQLKRGGRMVIPVGDMYYQELVIIDKKADGSIRKKRDIPCIFVPLIGDEGWDSDMLF